MPTSIPNQLMFTDTQHSSAGSHPLPGSCTASPFDVIRNLKNRRARINLLALLLLVIGTMAQSVRAQCGSCFGIDYDASSGFPEFPCWTASGTDGITALDGGKLTISSSGGGGGYLASRPGFLWSQGHTMEARLRVPVGGASALPGFRAAAYVGAVDALGRNIILWVWSNGVGISTEQNATPGPGLSTIDFDAASTAHTYTVISNEVGIVLLIDGVERTSLPYTNTGAFSINLQFGSDTRTTGAAVTEWEFVRFQSIRNPVNTSVCAGSNATFTASGTGSGPFSYQWEWRPVGAPSWVNVVNGSNTDPGSGTTAFSASGATSGTLSISAVSASGSKEFRARINASCGAVTSDAAVLSVPSCTFATCVADFDGSGGTPDSSDIAQFFAAWLAGNECADTDCSGGTPEASDINVFFARWLAGDCG